jgi:uncharacterized protein YndB with AHSA1/START domain/uncharacterized protein YciI
VSVPSIRREVLVDADPQTAFEVFTARIAHWWPLAEHSVYGAGSTVAFDGGQIIERGPDGATSLWGTVTRWEPPGALAYSWHPGHAPDRASHVEITFAAVDGQTLVTVEHSGWEVYADPAAARAEYNQGWPMVLDRYREYADDFGEASGDGPDDTWVALMHRPGPAAPASGPLVEDPRFAEHVAFLTRMQEAGYLIAAGPMGDRAGEGMTILRLPGADQLATATRLATEDDASVAGGLLAVTVRWWQPMMQAEPWAGGS